MAQQEIEFLKLRKAKTRQELLLEKLRRISLIVLVVYALVLGVVFSIWFILERQEKNLVAQIEVKKNRIEEFKNTESLQVILKQRLSGLTKILEIKKLDYAEILKKLNNLSSEGMILTHISITGDADVVFTGEADNSPALARFINKLLSYEDIGFKKITLNQINRDANGRYSFTISFSQPK